MTQQLSLFDWQPPRKVLAFPHARRADVIRRIVRVFVERGYNAGNKAAFGAGCALVAELHRLGYSSDAIARELDRFIAAWRAASIAELRCQPFTDGHAA